MYTIEVDYTTGNSFNSERQTEEIGLVFTTKELARKALLVIKEHYALHEEIDSYGKTRDYKEIDKDGNSRQWCVDGVSCYKARYSGTPCGGDTWRYHVAVEVSEGELRELNVGMWSGYFETLHSARIISVGNDEDFMEF